MRVSVLGFRSKILLRSAALGLIASLGAGCSSDFSRFAPTSNDYTGSVNQKQIIFKQLPQARQEFPDETPIARAPADNEQTFDQPMYTGSVQSDGSIRPVVSSAKSGVQRTVLAPVSAAVEKFPAPISPARRAVMPQAFPSDIETAQPAPVVAGTLVGTKPKKFVEPIDQIVTGTVPNQTTIDAPVQPEVPAGWSARGGTAINVRSGDTVLGLAKRHGVPANAILGVNGMAAGSILKSGQRLIIPNFNADKADKSTVTKRAVDQAPTDTLPMPKPATSQKTVAVLPNTPQLKTKQADETTTSSNVEQPGFKVISKRSAVIEKTVSGDNSQIIPAKKNAAAKGSYTIASGDSLYTIAKKHGTSVAALKAFNSLEDGKLKIGQTLKIPRAGAVSASAAKAPAASNGVDSVATETSQPAIKEPAVAVKTPTLAKGVDDTKTAAIKPASSDVIEDAQKDTSAAPGSTGISKLRWPVRGRTLSGYGQAVGGKVNDGIDISVPNGTPVKSAENGVVIYAGAGLKDFGNTVLVRHDNGLVTVYGNNGNISVKRGQVVKRGQELAKSGMSGNTKVPKLHFEVRKNSAPINPAAFLE